MAQPAGSPPRWPAIIAHRGASSRYPENTLAAFEGAVEAGADLVELDVRLSADGVLVVIHDPDVGSTTNGEGLVSELTLRQIKRLDAVQGQLAPAKIPTLGEALAVLDGRAAVEIEIKNAADEPGFEPAARTATREVLALLAERRFRFAFIASFDPDCVEYAKTCAPDVATGLLIDGASDPEAAVEQVTRHGHELLLVEASLVDALGRGFVDGAHERGITLCAWTVDDRTAIERLFTAGIDGIETNDPVLGLAARDRARARAAAPAERGAAEPFQARAGLT